MHDSDHASQVVGEKAAILSLDRANYDIAGVFGCFDASVDLFEAAIKVGAEDISRKIAIFEAAIKDQPVPRFPADGVIGLTKRHAAHNVINDVDESGSGRFEGGKLFEGWITALFAEILDFGVKRVFAWKMFVEQRLRDAGGFG